MRSTLVLHLCLHSLFLFVLTLCPCNILMAFIILGNSSTIIFAAGRSTLLLLHFLLHSLFFRIYRCAAVPLGLSQNDVTSRRVM